MKKLILSMIVVFSSTCFALPIVNESVATNSIYTVYRDHNNSDLYYISPNFMSIAEDVDGTPLFNYTEYKVGGYLSRKRNANIQMILRVKNYEEELQMAKDTILSDNPNARFALVPFESSRVEFDDKFRGMFLDHSCTHPSGEYSAEQSCILNLSHFGHIVFKNNIKKRLTLVLKFFKVQGVERRADNSFQDATREFQIAGRVGGDILAPHPHLFTDYKGRWIYFD